MIYKIVTDFSDLIDIVEKLKNNYNIIMTQGQLFICEKNYKTISLKKLKKEIGKENVFISQIDENNLKYESPEVITWCRDYFVDRDVKRYEEERQDEIKNFMNILDDFEKELKKMVKKGGVANNARTEAEGETSQN